MLSKWLLYHRIILAALQPWGRNEHITDSLIRLNNRLSWKETLEKPSTICSGDKSAAFKSNQYVEAITEFDKCW